MMFIMMKQNPLSVLFLTIFLDMLGVGILIPVMPLLFTNPHSSHYLLGAGLAPSFGYILLGLTIALYSFGQFIAAPIIGQFSDKFGRKRMLIFTVVGSMCAHALFAIALSWKAIPLLLFARLVGGVSGGNIVVAQAAIADISKPEDRVKNFGLIGAAFGLGFVVGPFLGGRLADPTLVSWFNATTPFWFAAGLSLVNAILVVRNLKETNVHVSHSLHIDWSRALKNIRHALSLKELRPLFITNFLYQMGFAFYTTFAAVYFFARFGFTEAMLGNYFAYVGVWIVISQAVLTRLAAKHFTSQTILKSSLFWTGLLILLIVLLPRPFWLLLSTPFFAAVIGLSQANLTALISRSAGANIQGEVLGINGSVQAFAMMIPPLVSGVLVAATEPAASLVVAGMLTIGAGVYFVNHMKRENRDSTRRNK